MASGNPEAKEDKALPGCVSAAFLSQLIARSNARNEQLFKAAVMAAAQQPTMYVTAAGMGQLTTDQDPDDPDVRPVSADLPWFSQHPAPDSRAAAMPLPVLLEELSILHVGWDKDIRRRYEAGLKQIPQFGDAVECYWDDDVNDYCELANVKDVLPLPPLSEEAMLLDRVEEVLEAQEAVIKKNRSVLCTQETLDLLDKLLSQLPLDCTDMNITVKAFARVHQALEADKQHPGL